MVRDVIDALRRARAAEKAQALFYRALAAEAAAVGDDDAVERLNGLHADEQHHLSRISARLLELGESLDDLPFAAGRTPLDSWEVDARAREREEIARYAALLELDLDESTAALAQEILQVERTHERELGGKWTLA